MARSTPPAKSGSAVAGSAAAGRPLTAAERKTSAEQLGQRLLCQLAALRVQTLSLHNGEGELLWLSEGTFGPDEHGFVLDALDLFVLDASRPHFERTLEDGRRALFLCARTPLGERCGLAMAVVEARSTQAIDSELLTPPVSRIMRQFSMLLAPAIAAPAAATAPASAAPASPARAPSVAAAPRVKAAPPAAAPAPAIGAIHARRYARLRSGGSTRRYEISSTSPAGADDLAVSLRAIEFLQRMRERYQQEPATFTVPLGRHSVTHGEFWRGLEPALQKSALADGILGFCLPDAAWSAEPAPVQRFISQCERLKCFVTLDDFNLGKSGFALLRSSSVRCLKLEAELIGRAMNDKFSQASLSAICQAARVLGLYCVAKGVETAAQARWLASAGIEFSDGISRAGTSAATTKSGELLTLEPIS